MSKSLGFFVFRTISRSFLTKDCDVFRFDLKQFVCAVQSSVKQTSIFQKREPNAVRTNYNPFVLYLWQGNMDFQYVTPVYGAAKHIASYISKPNKGVSELTRNSNKQSLKQPDNRSDTRSPVTFQEHWNELHKELAFCF